MAFSNLQSFHNFNMMQQQRAQATKPQTVTQNPQQVNQPQIKPPPQAANRGQVRQPQRNRRQQQNGPAQNQMLQRLPHLQNPQQIPQQQMPHTQFQQPQMVPPQAQHQQMPNRQMQQPQMQHPQMPQPQMQLSADQQVAQYMNGEAKGIPINEENINMLIKTLNETDAKKNQTPGPQSPQSLAQMPSANPNGIKPEASTLMEKLARFIQNETNGSAFYLHLNKVAPNQIARQNFEEISSKCRQRAESFGKIYMEKSGNSFEAKNVIINNQVSFKDGIQLALNEERKSITDLFNLYEEISDARTEKMVSLQVFKKLIDLNFLMDMKNSF